MTSEALLHGQPLGYMTGVNRCVPWRRRLYQSISKPLGRKLRKPGQYALISLKTTPRRCSILVPVARHGTDSLTPPSIVSLST